MTRFKSKNNNNEDPGRDEASRTWELSYCDFNDLEYQYNIEGIVPTKELLDRLADAARDGDCMRCTMSLTQLGEPRLISLVDDDPTTSEVISSIINADGLED